MTSDFFKDPSLFRKELEKGYPWQRYVAEFLSEHGFYTYVPPLTAPDTTLTVEESMEKAKDFADEPDLLCDGLVIEVKSRELQFTCPEDFPFRTVIVDTVSGFRQKQTKPHFHVSVSRSTGAIIALETASTFDKWKEVWRWDNVRKFNSLNYECDKSLWVGQEKFVSLLKKVA